MSEVTPTPEKRSLWVRVLLMLLMGLAFHIAVTILGALALVQLVFAAISDGPNERLQHFGRGLGVYLRHITDFVSFAREDLPFPFSDWPSTD
ncbi:MAG: DUF4389 domain-containing protein [Curvibacter sp.]|jgi:hypothetical protein|nr:DUF4389 domain-containing protein [Curvibacter sp.]